MTDTSPAPAEVTWNSGDDPWEVPGQRAAATVMRGAVAGASVGHAWALMGPSGVGQQRLGRALAAALSCPTPPAPGQPCGTCAVCERIRTGSDPAVVELERTGANHRVEEVRSTWLREAARIAVGGGWTVLCVRDADRMNDPAANAFLKGLEEPPPRTVWLLDVADPDELPDTILSRCRPVVVASWGRAALDAEARRLGIDDPTDRALAVRSSFGSPGVLRRRAVAASMTEGTAKRPAEAVPGGLDDLRRHRGWMGAVRTQGPRAALAEAHLLSREVSRRSGAAADASAEAEASLAERFGDEVPKEVRVHLEATAKRRDRELKTAVHTEALDDVLSWVRDALARAGGADPDDLIHLDDLAGLDADLEAYGPDGLLAVADRVLTTREALERNVGTTLAIEALGMDLHALSLGR